MPHLLDSYHERSGTLMRSHCDHAQGRILDTGTLTELRDRHQENDFEELFFFPAQQARRTSPRGGNPRRREPSHCRVHAEGKSYGSRQIMNAESSPFANDGESLSKNRSKWKAVFNRREMIDQLREIVGLCSPLRSFPSCFFIPFSDDPFSSRNSNKSIRSPSVFLGKTILMSPYRFLTAMDLQKNSKTVCKIDLVYYNWGTVKLGSSVKDVETTRWIEEGRLDAVCVPPEFLDHSARASQDVAK